MCCVKRRVVYFSKLLFKSNEKKFSFRRVESQKNWKDWQSSRKRSVVQRFVSDVGVDSLNCCHIFFSLIYHRNTTKSSEPTKQVKKDKDRAQFPPFVVVVDNRLIIGVKCLQTIGNCGFVVIRSTARFASLQYARFHRLIAHLCITAPCSKSLYKSYSTQRSIWCLRQASKSMHRPCVTLVFRPPKLTISCLCAVTTCVYLASKSFHSF